jgi:hypothetical protein
MNKSVTAVSYALAPMQAGMLFQHLYSPLDGVNIEQLVCSFAGVDEVALEYAWQQVWQANDVLRTGFVWSGSDQPVQSVYTDIALPWRCLDWRNQPGDHQAELQTFLRLDRLTGFQLDQPPLMRFTLIKSNDDSGWFGLITISCWMGVHFRDF